MPERRPLRIGDGRDWHFVNGAWQDGKDDGLAVAADDRRAHGAAIQGHHYAFHRNPCYRDARIRFEFRLTPHSDAGIVLRARDASRFYLLHFPNCGQASRAQHFWVALSRMDESGYLRRVKMELVRRVPSNSGRWLSADVLLAGASLSVRVGERGRFSVEDDALAGAGRLGVYAFGDAAIRGLTVEGQPVVAGPWDDGVRQPTNWFHPCPDPTPGLWQRPLDLLRFPDGELLLSFAVQERAFEGRVTSLLTRSRDGGRTWTEPEPLLVSARDGGWEPDRLHLTPGGRLISLSKTDGGYLAAESPDRGRTWSGLAPANLASAPPGLSGIHLPPQAFLNLADGSMVLFGYGARSDLTKDDLTVYTWGAVHCQAFACRSTDDGRSWSAWVNLDGAGRDDHFEPAEPDKPLGRPIDGNLDLTEPCAAQLGDGRVMVLVRPIYSPWMWETWSADGGASWGPCVRGPFPGYATSNLLRTGAGALLVAHRLPSMTIHASWDEGDTWDEGTLVDSATWAMGAMTEVDPGVVLYVYWDSFESLMRAQLIRPTPTGLQPLRRLESQTGPAR